VRLLMLGILKNINPKTKDLKTELVKKQLDVLIGLLIGLLIGIIFIASYNSENIGEAILSWKLPLILIICAIAFSFFRVRNKNSVD